MSELLTYPMTPVQTKLLEKMLTTTADLQYLIVPFLALSKSPIEAMRAHKCDDGNNRDLRDKREELAILYAHTLDPINKKFAVNHIHGGDTSKVWNYPATDLSEDVRMDSSGAVGQNIQRENQSKSPFQSKKVQKILLQKSEITPRIFGEAYLKIQTDPASNVMAEVEMTADQGPNVISSFQRHERALLDSRGLNSISFDERQGMASDWAEQRA